jgi:hypothetical protein
MYLGASIAVRMPDGSTLDFSGISTDLQNAILAGGKPMRPDGSYYNTQLFMGGWLFDNCPLNVILGQGWLPGQMDALKAAGLTPYCPQYQPPGSVALPPPALSQVPAPGFQLQTAGASGARLYPTGVATPTAPTIVTLSSGQAQVIPAEPAQEAGVLDEAGMFSGGSWLPWAAISLGLAFAFGKKRG